MQCVVEAISPGLEQQGSQGHHSSLQHTDAKHAHPNSPSRSGAQFSIVIPRFSTVRTSRVRKFAGSLQQQKYISWTFNK
jgi:hypothetical protein